MVSSPWARLSPPVVDAQPGNHYCDRMTCARISSRMAIWFAIAAIGLEIVASGLYWAAGGFPKGLDVDPRVLLKAGSSGATLIRWGSLVDLFGYLCIAPVVLHLRERYAASRFSDLWAAAGLALVVIGSIGAATMAAAAPPLINEYAAGTSAQRPALEPVFATLYRSVVVGIWQTLETIPATVWLLGTATAARKQGPRADFLILSVLGVITGGIALDRLVAY